MYDFYFLGQEHLRQDISEYLIFVKRTLPRWVNSIPDNEFLEVYQQACETLQPGDVVVETGCGASSLALVAAAIQTGGEVFSWDLNGSKLELMGNVAFQTIGRAMGADINKYWHPITYSSTGSYLGIEIIQEKKRSVGLAFLDSYHTLEHVIEEIRLVSDSLRPGAAVIIDDAYYTNKSLNYSYLNLMRKKLGMAEIPEPEENISQPYWYHVEAFLKKKFETVTSLDAVQRADLDDVFFRYYAQDRMAINEFGMEDESQLQDRFKMWTVGRARAAID